MTAVRLGADPIASIVLQGAHMPDSVLQGIANLVAIGLERAKSQEPRPSSRGRATQRAVEMARQDMASIDIQAEVSNLGDTVRDVVAATRTAIDTGRSRFSATSNCSTSPWTGV